MTRRHDPWQRIAAWMKFFGVQKVQRTMPRGARLVIGGQFHYAAEGTPIRPHSKDKGSAGRLPHDPVPVLLARMVAPTYPYSLYWRTRQRFLQQARAGRGRAE